MRSAQHDQALELTTEVLKTELLTELIVNLPMFEFECRKDVTQVFSNVLRKRSGGAMVAVDWLAQRPQLLFTILGGYDDPKVALNYGTMFRECCRHEGLVALFLPTAPSRHAYSLFGYIESPHFDVASDAFASLRELLTKHRPLVARFLEEQYDDFFACYHGLLRSENYVTKRQSLKLLSDLLLDRANFATMTRYITSSQHMKTIMVLLRDPSPSIQFEAFHVFKIFVANPNKGRGIHDVLHRNKDKLLAFLNNFHNDRGDEQFSEEKKFLVHEISLLDHDGREQDALNG